MAQRKPYIEHVMFYMGDIYGRKATHAMPSHIEILFVCFTEHFSPILHAMRLCH